MCTISLTPHLKDSTGFILTSNRDEASERETYSPHFKTEKETLLLFPEDAVAGGSWIGVSEQKRVLCLMNGGFEAHKREVSYRKSRGVVLKDWLIAENIKTEIEHYNLYNIEPFTVVIADWSLDLFFAEFVWDGKEKHFKDLPLQPQIWSSSPLYTSEMKKFREEWFSKFQKQKNLSAKNLWEFHHSAGKGDKEVDLIIDRGFLKTKSISQVAFLPGKLKFKYEDLQKSEITNQEFPADLI
ncbi:NRDE family protein [Salegentibacter salegens]|uniref:Transport and Golgi organisation 2 n=1 Tax=Salegentibacter salegens TaxID=143223 RepID=A0A1M7L0Y2_9FLAO|nr:NRDE family protein [Salegentibacter salegens]PRX44860.1 transport and Golgi organization protein 2 [Salegentibacter salegens]SHM71371.1 Transport and Golgi organisation 2 [Salegentibacter salegens]